MKKIILGAACAAMLAGTAQAGVMNYTNGQGVWQPTQCARPVAPNPQTNSETPAGLMNRTTTGFNGYIQETNRYMECITAEAKADADMAGKTVLSSLQNEINGMQAEVTMQRGQLARRY